MKQNDSMEISGYSFLNVYIANDPNMGTHEHPDYE